MTFSIFARFSNFIIIFVHKFILITNKYYGF